MAKVVDTKTITPTDLGVAFKRSNAIPFDVSEYYTSYAEAAEYAKSGATALVGQFIKVVENGELTIYFVDTNGDLQEIGGNIT